MYFAFRAFKKFEVPALPAIVINYFVTVVIGWIAVANTGLPEHTLLYSLGTWSLLLGVDFIIVFYLLSATTALIGVSGSTIISRMSMVIPAAVSVIVFKEEVTLYKVLGLLLAAVAIVLSAGKSKSTGASYKVLVIPILAFIGTGVTDAAIKLIQQLVLGGASQHLMMAFIFTAAAVSGFIYLTFKRDLPILRNKKVLKWGLVLGCINYASLYLFLLALDKSKLEGSVIFPINSVGIVAVGTLGSILLFKEVITLRKLVGVAIAILAILLFSL